MDSNETTCADFPVIGSDDEILTIRQASIELGGSRHKVVVACAIVGVRLRPMGVARVLRRQDLALIRPYVSKSSAVPA